MNLRSFFRFLYNTSYWILCFILAFLILITPGDAIRQAYQNKQLYNVFVVAGCYVLTGLLAGTIYLVRLYTNRQILAAIPKTWIPVEKGDVNKKVRKMIVASLSRSAVIAWDARPRLDPTPPAAVSDPDAREAVVKTDTNLDKKKRHGVFWRHRRVQTEKDDHIIVIPSNAPVWGDISHKGWSPPESPDLPNIQYTTVILELPHLIEARAVSMAPPETESGTSSGMPDIRAVDLLQRPASIGLRDYMSHLLNIGVLMPSSTATHFLTAYEHARFSPEPLAEVEFRCLMKLFAEVLRGMQPLSPAMLASLDISPPESDIDDDNSSSTTPRSRSSVSTHTASTRSASQSTTQTAQSRRVATDGTSSTTRHVPNFSTAPATPRSRKRVAPRSPNMNTFSQSRMPYNDSSAGSSTSLVPSRDGSVIRLRATNEQSDLPYTLMIPGSQ